MIMLEGYGHIVDFFTSIRWWELEPDNTFIQIPQESLEHRIYASRSKKGDLAVVYFSVGTEITIKPGILNKELKAEWFNPRNGCRTPAESQQASTYRAQDEQDWILLFYS